MHARWRTILWGALGGAVLGGIVGFAFSLFAQEGAQSAGRTASLRKRRTPELRRLVPLASALVRVIRELAAL